ncbi:MAG: ABC-2 family transporter protein [Anaerolineales bacterium]|nr:ABC-2 family transporter protein [Anaerolineales bacterium]
MRGYLAYLRGAMMVGVVYRAGFLFIVIGNVLYMIIAYFLWRSIYGTNAVLHGLTFDQAILYVALGSTVFLLLKTYADYGMAGDIRSGAIAIFLTKPVDYQFYTLAVNLGFTSTTMISVTIPTVLLMILLRISIPLGWGLLFFPLSLALAFVINFNFDYIIGLMSFYTEAIWGMSTTKEIIIAVLSGALLPLQFFPEAVQRVLMWLPFQAIYFTPLMMVTRPDQELAVFLRMIAVQAFWLGATYALTRLVYTRAVKVLRVAGG